MRWCHGSLQDDVRHHEEEVSEGEEEMLEDEACCSEFREKMSWAVGGRKS